MAQKSAGLHRSPPPQNGSKPRSAVAQALHEALRGTAPAEATAPGLPSVPTTPAAATPVGTTPAASAKDGHAGHAGGAGQARARPTLPITTPTPSTAPARGAYHDPLATIAQPANPPLPTPLAQALAPLRNAVQVRLPEPGPSARAAQARAADLAPPSFADLLREQNRRPPPQALLDKLADAEARAPHGASHPPQATGSMIALPISNHRKSDHTDLHRAQDAFTAPPGQTTEVAHPLQGLRVAHQALQAQRAQAKADEAQRRSAAQARDVQRQAFLRAVGAVTALPDPQRAQHHLPRDPVPAQRLADEQAVLRESLSDEFDAGTLLDTDDKLSFLRPGVSLDIARRLRRGEWTIQKQVDLHGLRTDEAREALGAFIRESHRAGVRCVRVIHGKGLGSPGKMPVLKSRVNRWLVQKAEVMAFVQANPNQGGDGAVVVLLRPARR